MAYADGPCAPWPVLWGTCRLEPAAVAVTGVAVEMASQALWAASGRRFGPCSVTLRPCRETCPDAAGDWFAWGGGDFVTPRFFRGVWSNVTCGSCTSGCSCGPVPQVVLPGPVAAVTEVRIDGAVLAPAAYRLDNRRYLVRIDGGDWPDCNDLTRNDGPGTWSVTLTLGADVPVLGQAAAGELAAEFATLLGCGKCRLPNNIASLARQGVTVELGDGTSLLDTLPITAAFLRTYNPHKLTSGATLMSPDAPRPRVMP